MLTFYPSRIPDPGVKKVPDPGFATMALGLNPTGGWEKAGSNHNISKEPIRMCLASIGKGDWHVWETYHQPKSWELWVNSASDKNGGWGGGGVLHCISTGVGLDRGKNIDKKEGDGKE